MHSGKVSNKMTTPQIEKLFQHKITQSTGLRLYKKRKINSHSQFNKKNILFTTTNTYLPNLKVVLDTSFSAGVRHLYCADLGLVRMIVSFEKNT